MVAFHMFQIENWVIHSQKEQFNPVLSLQMKLVIRVQLAVGFLNVLIYAIKCPNNSVSDGLCKMINKWQFLISESHLGLLAAGMQKSVLMTAPLWTDYRWLRCGMLFLILISQNQLKAKKNAFQVWKIARCLEVLAFGFWIYDFG